jgi:hypothetical protein
MTIRAASLRVILGSALIALPAAACSSHPPAESSAPHSDREVLTQQQMMERSFQTAWDAVEAMRSNWLQVRGTDSFGINSNPSEIWVYMDNNKLGGIDALKAVTVSSIVYIRHYDGVAATARWGVGHSMGVIFISTH